MWSNAENFYKILHIVENGRVYPDALNRFKDDFRKCISYSDKLAENYSEANFDIESNEMFDALYTENGEFVACTGILKRNQWPEGMYRLLNRTYFSPSFRKSHSFAYYASDYLLPSQIKRFNKKLDFSFVSRQGKNAGNFLKKLKERPFFKDHYRLSDIYIQIAAGMDDKSFQKILYYKSNPTLSFQLNGIKDLSELPEGIERVMF